MSDVLVEISTFCEPFEIGRLVSHDYTYPEPGGYVSATQIGRARAAAAVAIFIEEKMKHYRRTWDRGECVVGLS